MTVLDKAMGSAARGVQMGRARIDELMAQRQYRKLLRQLGEACYAEHQKEGTREAVEQRLAALDEHARMRSQKQAMGRLAAGRQARDIMHAGAECIGENETLAAAAGRMRDLGVGSLPICGADDRLHGIITDRDIAVKCVAEGRDPAQVRAGELAQGTVFWVDAAADIGEVLHQMEDHRIKRLPVIENHRLVGMISEADLARHLDEHRLAEFVEKVYATS
jgi:CBS domain-containing protein